MGYGKLSLMPIKPLDFIEFAESLLSNPLNEAGLRSAISRSYYGAFLHTQEYVDAKLAPIAALSDGVGVHEALIRRLRAEKAMKSRSAAYQLTALRTMRVTADYKTLDVFELGDAEEAIANSKKLISTIDELMS